MAGTLNPKNSKKTQTWIVCAKDSDASNGIPTSPHKSTGIGDETVPEIKHGCKVVVNGQVVTLKV